MKAYIDPIAFICSYCDGHMARKGEIKDGKITLYCTNYCGCPRGGKLVSAALLTVELMSAEEETQNHPA